ncbi:zf-HC2 domain-containing protein [Pseudothauera lacus]|uniref:Putative zinc-finger domain-containing protein n=1 Tax=Pseudothauera lacus TaxID=2136175 RepID=A0A2T4IC40_9RHOO|nr:zf-HC2 domain-containing protein [Pseudothauera lacus]PTD95349.1 hypothetical protein C8261_15150 [Pseudothauera lacus]
MLSCKKASRLCSEALDRELGLRERLALRMHLMMCSGCTNYHDQMAFIRRVTTRFADGDLPPHGETGSCSEDTPENR